MESFSIILIAIVARDITTETNMNDSIHRSYVRIVRRKQNQADSYNFPVSSLFRSIFKRVSAFEMSFLNAFECLRKKNQLNKNVRSID